MSADLLAKLKPLQRQRGDVSPFATHTEFQTWSDNALPLLAFNPVLQSQLKSAVRAAYINLGQELPKGVLSNINRAIGIVNQAVISLEVNPVPDSKTNPASNNSISPSDIWQRPIGAIWVIVVGGLVLAGAVYLIKNHLGISL
jgi:hypothetical protein